MPAKKNRRNKLSVVFASNDFWAVCYVNGRNIYQGDDVNSDNLLRKIFGQLPIVEYKNITVTEEQYNQYFESNGYPATLEEFYAKITSK
jgi:hypothetical protein